MCQGPSNNPAGKLNELNRVINSQKRMDQAKGYASEESTGGTDRPYSYIRRVIEDQIKMQEMRLVELHNELELLDRNPDTEAMLNLDRKYKHF